jgi:hypothetical protein
VVKDLKYDLFSSVSAAKLGLTSVIDFDLATGENHSYTIDQLNGNVTPLVERGRGILELPLHLMLPTSQCLSLTQNFAPVQPEFSPNVISTFWHYYDDPSHTVKSIIHPRTSPLTFSTCFSSQFQRIASLLRVFTGT